MLRRHKVIMLCGNPEFIHDFIKEQRKLTRAGNVVIGTASHDRTYKNLSMSEKILLDLVVKQQIEMADEILVINHDDKIDQNTNNNIQYAVACGTPIKYMETHHA